MTTHPFLFLVAVGVALWRPSSAVRSNSKFCCENRTIQFNQNCTASFSYNGMNIADSNGCIPPCQEIGPEHMTLDQCVDVMARYIMVSTEKMTVIGEEIIYYHGQNCSGSDTKNTAAGNQTAGLGHVLLLGLGIAVKFKIY